MVRYRVKPDQVATNESLVRAVYADVAPGVYGWNGWVVPRSRLQSRTASSNCAAVKGFCKNVVLTGIGSTVLPDIMMMFICGWRRRAN